MMRGTLNEKALMSSLQSKEFIRGIRECDMMADKGLPRLGCSPDGSALIDLDKTPFDGAVQSEQSLQICSIEIKTSVASSSLARALNNSGVDLICTKIGDENFKRRVPREHIEQLIQQMVGLRVKYLLYVSGSESALLSCTLTNAIDEFLETCRNCLKANCGPLVGWAHEQSVSIPAFVDMETKKHVNGRLSFWKLVNDCVQTNDAFVPLKL